MLIWNNAPHRCTTYTSANTRDGGGGSIPVYTLAQSNIPCLINTSGANEQERFAQMGIVVTHKIAFKTSVLTTPLVRGMKIVDSAGNTYHLKSINGGQQFMGIVPLIYADCEQQL